MIDDPIITIARLPDWMTFYDIRVALKLTKQGVHRMVFDSGHFDVTRDVVGIQSSASQYQFLVRRSAVSAEIDRRVAAGKMAPPPE